MTASAADAVPAPVAATPAAQRAPVRSALALFALAVLLLFVALTAASVPG